MRFMLASLWKCRTVYSSRCTIYSTPRRVSRSNLLSVQEVSRLYDTSANCYSPNALRPSCAPICRVVYGAGRVAPVAELTLARGLAVTERGGWPTGVLSEGRLKFASTDSAHLQPPNWLVPGWIGRNHLTLLIGDGSAGKSTLASDLAVALASGQPWLGVPTQPAKVMYLDEDGPEPDLINRILSFRAGRNVLDTQLDSQLLIHPASGFSLESDIDFKALCVAGAGVDLIIWDALVAFHSKDENQADQMRYVMRSRLRPLMRATGAAFSVIHHVPGPDENGAPREKPRGSTEIRNACDAILMCTAGETAHDLKVKRCRFARKIEWADPVSITLESTDEYAKLTPLYATKTLAAVNFLMGFKGLGSLTVSSALGLLAANGVQVSREIGWKALSIAQSRVRSVIPKPPSNEA